ncbi:MAG: GTP 3',8-cyclase MoaA [Oleiphilus sp.]
MSLNAPLIDKFGRQVSYVRISVTDRCDFRCVYCMDEEMTFVSRADVLSLEEIQSVAEAFVELGVSKIRLTGGEPLVRSNVLSLCESLGKLPDLNELVMTTNGSQLVKYASRLKAAGLRRLNISLDTLDAQQFKELTRVGKLESVLQGIDTAIAQGFERIKLNAVILKGRNHQQILPLVEFAIQKGIDISFIEEMPLGAISEHSREETFCSNDEIFKIISAQYCLRNLDINSKTSGPSDTFQVSDTSTRVGFISPHSHNFCGDCNRVRVTAEGRLLLCLGNEHSVDLRQVIRQFPNDKERLKQTIIEAMDLKPKQHEFDHSNEPDIIRFMNMTGG